MRLFTAALALALLVPAAAGAKARNPGACMHIARQLVHYDSMRAQAAERGQDLWVGRFEDHLERLEGHFAARCPEQYAEQKSIQELAALLKSAGRAALSFFTLGLY